MKKKSLFIAIMSLAIIGILVLTSTLDIISFKKNFTLSTADNNAVVASGIVHKIEYALRYGKSLANYYGVDDLFSQLQELIPYINCIYITGMNGVPIYTNGETPEPNSAAIAEMLSGTGGFYCWTIGNAQQVLIPVKDKTGSTIAGFGFSYDNLILNEIMRPYTGRMVQYTVIAALIGICIFVILFFTIKHDLKYKKLLWIIIPSVVISNVFMGATSYNVYRSGYIALVEQTSDMLWTKINSDIQSVIGQGVRFDELYEIEVYFDNIISATKQIDDIWLAGAGQGDNGTGAVRYYTFEPDSSGNVMRLGIKLSEGYIREKLNSIIVEICVSGIITLMIAAEIILFSLTILTGLTGKIRLKREVIVKARDTSVQPVGIIRGLTFFFAMFQYMAITFIPIVMIHIYKPVFGLPLGIMATIPITVQIFMSILFSWISGGISEKWGWRTTAILGMLVMAVGALIASISTEPVLFIISQAVLGSGIGLAKTAFDIFGVLAPASRQLEEYSASTNAGLIVGMSCSATIGAVIADVLGFNGAFLSMGCFGLFVIGLVAVFSDNIMQAEKNQPQNPAAQREKGFNFDLKYAAYIAFLILPYSFISMYVDYFFPVYADSNGMTTTGIGNVFLMYGILTSYVGSFLCKYLSKRIRTVFFATLTLALLGINLSLFAVLESLAYATAFMLLIAIADGIMPSLQYRFVYSLDITKQIGLSRVIGMESAFGNAIRGIAPVIFGTAMLFGGTGLLIAGVLVFILSILFLAVNRKERT